MIKIKSKFQSTLKKRIKITGTGKILLFHRIRKHNPSFCYPKKINKRRKAPKRLFGTECIYMHNTNKCKFKPILHNMKK